MGLLFEENEQETNQYHTSTTVGIWIDNSSQCTLTLTTEATHPVIQTVDSRIHRKAMESNERRDLILLITASRRRADIEIQLITLFNV